MGPMEEGHRDDFSRVVPFLGRVHLTHSRSEELERDEAASLDMSAGRLVAELHH